MMSRPARPDPKRDSLLVMGQVLAPFGVKGWLKIKPFTQAADALLDYREWWIGAKDDPGRWRAAVAAEGRLHGANLLARLEGMVDRDQALALQGAPVAVERAMLPEPGPDEYYWIELVGMSVVSLEGAALGEVTDLTRGGAHEVLRVRGERERLIPFVGAIVREVDRQARLIRVDWQPDY